MRVCVRVCVHFSVCVRVCVVFCALRKIILMLFLSEREHVCTLELFENEFLLFFFLLGLNTFKIPHILNPPHRTCKTLK